MKTDWEQKYKDLEEEHLRLKEDYFTASHDNILLNMRVEYSETALARQSRDMAILQGRIQYLTDALKECRSALPAEITYDMKVLSMS